jgi:enoyl-CoA hydratase/carnithine racemase
MKPPATTHKTTDGTWEVLVDGEAEAVLTGESYEMASAVTWALNTGIYDPSEASEVAQAIAERIVRDQGVTR